jgi:hypothetical protein
MNTNAYVYMNSNWANKVQNSAQAAHVQASQGWFMYGLTEASSVEKILLHSIYQRPLLIIKGVRDRRVVGALII